MRREWLFRRSLLVADVVAIVGAFVLTVELSSRVAAADLGERLRACRSCCWGRRCSACTTATRRCCARRRWTRRRSCSTWRRCARCSLARRAGWSCRPHAQPPRGAVAVAGAAGCCWSWRARRRARSPCAWRRPSAACSSATRARPRRSGPSSPAHGGVKAEMVAHLDLDDVGSWSAEALLDAQAGGDPRAWRARWTCTARSWRRGSADARRDARPRAHAQGGRRAGQRAAAPARGGRLLGRVRRPARRDADGRQALRADPLLGGGQARLRPDRRLARAAGDRRR